jgi:hypothetical protein
LSLLIESQLSQLLRITRVRTSTRFVGSHRLLSQALLFLPPAIRGALRLAAEEARNMKTHRRHDVTSATSDGLFQRTLYCELYCIYYTRVCGGKQWLLKNENMAVNVVAKVPQALKWLYGFNSMWI